MTMATTIPRAGTMTTVTFHKMREAALADFTQRGDPPCNSRLARCRVCRATLGVGEGLGYDEYMTDGYRFTRRYVCASCEAATR
jgi:hypothetical protein